MTSIAIVGAGPQLGLAIARVFGAQGFDVALISRSHENLDTLVGKLTAEGVTAAAFPADVLARDALTRALDDAATRFGGIDVLEYSPSGGAGSTAIAPRPGEFRLDYEERIRALLVKLLKGDKT